jgi:hypothetical protein
METAEQTQKLTQTGLAGLGCFVSSAIVVVAPATAPAMFAPRSGRHLIGDSVTLV